ncbi:MAG: DUF4317 domain-containing protein [Eubacterium sp.]|nr:DUF4317 domain-containing protein [Eubacterium sp.]
MIKKEINEIKSLFDTIQECNILRLAGCYVNGERNKVKTFNERFSNIPEEEMYKYLEIFRRTLSGTPGKNLMDAAFTDENPGDAGKLLLNRLKDSELKDEDALDLFYDKVISNYNYVGNYLILLIYQAYDVPGMTSDGIEMDDASDEVYKYILCSICPMKLTKPGLGYDDDLGEIHTMRQIFAVELPETGFLYPAFNDRSSDDGSILYSSKRSDYLQDSMLDKVLNVSITLPAKQQKEGFTEFVTEILGEDTSFETVLSIHENLNQTVETKKSEAQGETVFLEKQEVKNVFEKSGVPAEKLSGFDERFDEQFSVKEGPAVKVEEKLCADNVAPLRSFEVKNANMVLRLKSRKTDIIGTRIIDGKKCLIIEMTDDLTVNGVPVERGNF